MSTRFKYVLTKKNHSIVKHRIIDSVEVVGTTVNLFTKELYSNNKVSAYVCKGRNGLKDLKDAILQVYNNKTYLSPSISDRLKSKNHLEITNYDIELLKLLSVGLSQDEISTKFKQKNISPSSLSSIEKKINKLKLHFNAQNTIHLVSITKDTGLI